MKYIPLIDEISYFILRRQRAYNARRIKKKNAKIHKTVSIGQFVHIDNNVEIGEGTYIRTGSQIYASKLGRVSIGKFCAIGSYTSIKARTHDRQNPTRENLQTHNARIEKEIVIGDRVWIGDHVFIREGVTIPNDCVIGANSVVTKSITEPGIYAGVPVKKIG